MTNASSKPTDAENIARMADRGQNVTAQFSNQFTVVRPAVQVVNVDSAKPAD